VIATHGRGFWIMDDVTALRQLAGVRAAAVTLFKPAAAIRARPASFTGTPMPKDEPTAANPPDGAIIDYALPPALKGPVTLSVFDAHGQLVRRFSSAEPVIAPNPATLPIAPEWVPAPMRLSTAAGMHRFVWNLRYPPLQPATPAEAMEGGGDAGVWAPPGAYTVELSVAGRHYRQPLTVLPDPRVQVSDAALQREFALARQVEQAGARADAADTEADHLLQALDVRRAQASPALRDAIDALMRQVADLSGVPLHPDPRNTMGSPPRRTDSLRALSMNLDKLQLAVDGADADPSPDAQAAYATLSKSLTATLAAWQQLKQTRLAALNRQLKAAGAKPVEP